MKYKSNLKKMEKTKRERNLLTIYIRDSYKPVVMLFQKAIETDKNILRWRCKKNDKLLSIAICRLMVEYLESKEKQLNEVAPETSGDIT